MNNQWLEVGKVYPPSFETVLIYDFEQDNYSLGFCERLSDGETEDEVEFIGFKWHIDKDNFNPTHFQVLEPPLTIKVHANE